jgi:hypothetical protein
VRIARPKFGSNEEVVLTRDKRFVIFHVTGRGHKTLRKGDTVEVERSEALYDDHGRFDRYWYHLTYGIGWSATAEEDEICPAGVLDRLALLCEDDPKQQEEDRAPAPWSYQSHGEDTCSS